jgi:hypothetical protein
MITDFSQRSDFLRCLSVMDEVLRCFRLDEFELVCGVFQSALNTVLELIPARHRDWVMHSFSLRTWSLLMEQYTKWNNSDPLSRMVDVIGRLSPIVDNSIPQFGRLQQNFYLLMAVANMLMDPDDLSHIVMIGGNSRGRVGAGTASPPSSPFSKVYSFSFERILIARP